MGGQVIDHVRHALAPQAGKQLLEGRGWASRIYRGDAVEKLAAVLAGPREAPARRLCDPARAASPRDEQPRRRQDNSDNSHSRAAGHNPGVGPSPQQLREAGRHKHGLGRDRTAGPDGGWGPARQLQKAMKTQSGRGEQPGDVTLDQNDPLSSRPENALRAPPPEPEDREEPSRRAQRIEPVKSPH